MSYYTLGERLGPQVDDLLDTMCGSIPTCQRVVLVSGDGLPLAQGGTWDSDADAQRAAAGVSGLMATARALDPEQAEGSGVGQLVIQFQAGVILLMRTAGALGEQPGLSHSILYVLVKDPNYAGPAGHQMSVLIRQLASHLAAVDRQVSDDHTHGLPG